MKTSARNRFVGKVAAVTRGAVNDEISLEIAGGRRIVAIVTRASADDLDLKTGREAFAWVKASSVILVVDAGNARFSTRNRFDGTVARVEPGAVSTEIVVDLGDGLSITAIVTAESAKALGLKPGAPVTALVKASSVILGTD